ncbi:uncharacterized protein LOC143558304 [Bidens hawaiensis]|uniref:uncharacterized protein LOC143558304 n=1 Tax=Bidens hawaiensis TaxID=980011 RepID=UPI00404B7BB9
MAQYGGDQHYGRDNVRQTDEHGNPVRRTDEYETVVHSAAGERYERDVRHVDEFGNTIHITEEYGINPSGTTGHQGLGTNIGQATGGTGTDYASGGRSAGYQGLGTDYGATGQAHRTGTDATGGQTGHQSHGTADVYGGQTRHQGHGGIMQGDQGQHHGLAQATKGVGAGTYGTGIGEGTDYASRGRSTGGTAVSSQKIHTATPFGGASAIGTGTKDVYPHGPTGMEDTHEKKGMMQKIKEKLPGGHGADEQQTTTTAGGGYGETHEKKGMMEKIKEKLPGHH